MNRRIMAKNRWMMRRVPYFPFIPAVPIALVAGSLFAAIRALVRVRRLERRLESPAPA